MREKAYLEAIHTVKPNSDIILDGSLSVSEIINHAVEELGRRSDCQWLNV